MRAGEKAKELGAKIPEDHGINWTWSQARVLLYWSFLSGGGYKKILMHRYDAYILDGGKILVLQNGKYLDTMESTISPNTLAQWCWNVWTIIQGA